MKGWLLFDVANWSIDQKCNIKTNVLAPSLSLPLSQPNEEKNSDKINFFDTS